MTACGNNETQSAADELRSAIRAVDDHDIDGVLSYGRRYARLSKKLPAPTRRVAVLGECSVQFFTQTLRAMLFSLGLETELYEGEYGGVRMDALDDGSPFYAFRPERVILLPDVRSLTERPPLLSGADARDALIARYAEDSLALWAHIEERLPGCQIYTANYVVPVERALSALEANAPYSFTALVQGVNAMLRDRRPPYVTIVDLDAIASCEGKYRFLDPSAYALYKLGYAIKYTGVVCRAFARLLAAASGLTGKCLVLDLDNTLWGGVVADEGPEGIQLDPNDPIGESFLAFQAYVKALRARGVLLAVCSKNDEQIAREPFTKNPYMLLKLDDFAAFFANWDDKATNLAAIAAALNIGSDSLVFFDDNPAERALVAARLPQVTVVNVPEDPAYYARALEQADPFCRASLTSEDLGRADTYLADARRETLRTSAADYATYLTSLEMRGAALPPSDAQLARYTQLLNKTNQFNLRTVRRTEAEVRALYAAPESWRLIAVTLEDRFSAYGVIACAALEKRGAECFIDSWVMSCRVLKRGVEQMTFAAMLRAARAWGCDTLTGEYLPTRKNAMVASLYDELGFRRTPLPDGGARYTLALTGADAGEYCITEKEQAWT